MRPLGYVGYIIRSSVEAAGVAAFTPCLTSALINEASAHSRNILYKALYRALCFSSCHGSDVLLLTERSD